MTADWRSQSLENYLADLGSSAPTPGGGSAAAFAGALSAALGRMVVAVAVDRQATPERRHLLSEFEAVEERFLDSAGDDERAFTAVMESLRLPKEDPSRVSRLQASLAHAADVPLRSAETALYLLECLGKAEVHASRAIVSDIGVAAYLASASLSSSLLNVLTNLRSLADEGLRDRLQRAADELRASGVAAHADLTARVAERVAPASRE